MFNYFHSLIHRPELGWDPLKSSYAAIYSEAEFNLGVNNDLLDEIELWISGFEEKNILDLGGGAGQYSLAFAARGANVTWHDISGKYRKFAEEMATRNGLKIKFSVGYMDEAYKILNTQYDLVFNRICWNYCQSDLHFAHVIYDLTKDNGVIYIDTTNSNYKYSSHTLSYKFKVWLNNYLNIKIGHPNPQRGRVAKLLQRFDIEKLVVDYSQSNNDRILLKKKG